MTREDVSNSVVQSLTKWARTICFTSSIEFDQSLLRFLRQRILFRCLLQMVEKWKKVVLWSPRLAYWSRDFRAQKSSSCLRRFWYWRESSKYSLRRASVGCRAMALWSPFKRAISHFFRWNKLPKHWRFQKVTLEVKSLIAKETFSGKHLQEFLTISGKDRSLNHMVSSRKGRAEARNVEAEVLMSSGLWSDEVRGRWRTVASSNIRRQLGLHKTLSSLSITRPKGLLFVHVNRGSWKPKSSRSHESRQFLKEEILCLLVGVLLNFLWWDRISLKSLAIIQGKECKLAKDIRWSQRWRRDACKGLAYIAENNGWHYQTPVPY